MSQTSVLFYIMIGFFLCLAIDSVFFWRRIARLEEELKRLENRIDFPLDDRPCK